jgi:ATP-dependent helicase HrpA
MRIRVIDADGKVLDTGRDLATVRQHLQGRARESFAALPTPEFERDDVKDWDFGELPDTVEFTRNQIRLKGYPALMVQANGSVALRLVDSPERAEQTLRAGLRRLIMLRLRDKIRYLKRNLPDFQTMSLYFVRVGNQEALREDLLTAILDQAFLDETLLPRDRAAFAACLERGKARLLEVANEICGLVGQALATYHEVRKLLNGDIPFSWQEVAEDIWEQLDWLVYPGFVTHTPDPWLQHLPRYLKAIQVRLHKLKQTPDKDRQRRGEIGWLWEKYKRQHRHNVAQDIHDPQLEQFRWMLEELRVSLFAQELKTAFPVSLKRLEDQWRKVRI